MQHSTRSSWRLRKPGSGRPTVYDPAPSPEALAKRRQLAGRGDPNKTATVLDLLETNGLITPAQSEAGRHFGWLRRKVYGRVHPGAVDPRAPLGGAGSQRDDDLARLEKRYRCRCAALDAEGDGVRQVTEEVCILNRCTPWSGRSEVNAALFLRLLRRGLDAIARARAERRRPADQQR